LLKGIGFYDQKKYTKALENFKKANEYPENLEVGRPAYSYRFSQIYFYMGLTYEALKNQPEAEKYFHKAVDFEINNSPFLYYQGMAYQKLGKSEKAKEAWAKLQSYSESSNSVDFFAKFDEKSRADLLLASNYYTIGLSELSKQHKTEAISNFKRALEYDPNYYWAKSALSHLINL
jgi:tetratricopeptide (TPR) repeat protein